MITLAATITNFTIPAAYYRAADEQGVRADWLFSIALAESGAESLGLRLPWPWTLNIDGSGRRFSSRQTAERALDEALERTDWVDVGLMQVSWRYHQSRFETARHALDADINLRVGGAILAICFQERGDWRSAVGCYHAPSSPERADRYAMRVSGIREAILAKGIARE